MGKDPVEVQPLWSVGGRQLNEAVERFETAWLAGQRPAIEDHLPAGGGRTAVLVQLALVELELRLKAGEAARVEQYLERFPGLTEDRQVVLALAAGEYVQRRRVDPNLDVAEYFARFPQVEAELRARLFQSDDAPKGAHCAGPREPTTIGADDTPRVSGGDGANPAVSDTAIFRPAARDGHARQPVPTHSPSSITRIGDYEILAKVAEGRMGIVYKARQRRLNRIVALKRILGGDLAGADGLRQQAQVLGALDHPNIVRLIEVGEAQGHGFFSALEYVDGASLAEMSQPNLLDHDELVRIVRDVAAALDYAHGRNVVHGSVHPKHILLDQTGHVSVVGFGEVWPSYPEGMIFGNPHFLAPEQFAGFDKTVPQTDVYALAEVVFLLLSGSFPFRGAEGSEHLLRRKSSGPLPSVRACRPELPRGVDLTLQKAMALRPEERFPSAGKFVEELDRILRVGKKWWQLWR